MMLADRGKLKVKGKKYINILHRLITNYFSHNVGDNAAALAYYLIFAVFPLLIFVSNLLGLLQLDVAEVTRGLMNFLPRDIVQLLETYLEHISQTSSPSLLWFSLVFSVWFPLRAAKGLMNDVRLAYHLGKPDSSFRYTIRRLIYTVVLLIVLSRTLFISTFGRHVIEKLTTFLPYGTIRLSEFFITLWDWRRFALAAVLMYMALGALYGLSLDKKQPLRDMLPGIAVALLGWVVLSGGFSFYVENFADYSVIYGTLGAVMALLVWLYLTAVILIMGAELNAILLVMRREERSN